MLRLAFCYGKSLSNRTRGLLNFKGTLKDPQVSLATGMKRTLEPTEQENNKANRQGSDVDKGKVSAPPSSSAMSSDLTAAGQKVSVQKVFYRRPLPDLCIPFASDEGKQIFREALGTGHMNCYFRLASQFRTQDEPAYCGLSTLVMVLNALEIDPGRVWKGPWKWYHEDMLDCCVPTELIRKNGITFDEFICLADCNYLETQAVRMDSSCKEEDFRRLVKDMTLKEDSFLVLSYSRPALGQTGDGHFAPVSGYHADRDLVLILDTARFKYPPHWVSLSVLFEAMKRLDKSTGLPRGYVELWPAKYIKSLLLFKTSEQFSVNASPQCLEDYEAFLKAWDQQLEIILSLSKAEEDADSLAAVVTGALQGLVNTAGMLGKKMFVLRTQEHIRCTNSCNVRCVVEDLLKELEATDLYRMVCNQVQSLSEEDVSQLQNIFGCWPRVCVNVKKQPEGESVKVDQKQRCCDMNHFLCLGHFVTAFLLSWPYPSRPVPQSLGAALLRLFKDRLHGSHSQLLMDEVTTLHHQLKKLTGYHMPCNSSTKGEGACCCGTKEESSVQGESSTDKTCCSAKQKKISCVTNPSLIAALRHTSKPTKTEVTMRAG